jgi:molybdopterin-dependent oxidoreductase alpha subunit
MSKNNKISHAETPETHTGLRLGDPKDMAAGMPAVIQSARHILDEMGIGRGLKSLFALNQKRGIDCPGCAWPDPDDHRSGLGEYCENGAKAIAEEATTKSLTVDFFSKNSVYDLSLLSDYKIGKKGRIAQPMYLAIGATHYTEISWADAFQKIGTKLQNLKSPNEAIFYTSGRTSNEAAFLYQLFVREYGTNNLPDCSNMCHESSGVALNESLGIGKGSVKLEDFYKTEIILIFGQNPGTNHPRMLSALKKAKKNGATIVSINPIKEAGLLSFANPQELKGALNIKTKLTDIYLQVKINGDMALLKALMYRLIEEDKKLFNETTSQNINENFKNLSLSGKYLDLSFIEKNCHGFEDLVQHISTQNYNELVSQTGLEDSQIEEVVELLKSKNKIIACWAMGLTQHKNAVGTIQDIVNLLLLKGSIGKEGAGTCPVRGHSNVQGDRTMGIYEKPSKSFLDNLEKSFGFNPPREHGYDVVDAIKAMHESKAKVFFAMGGNFLSATPDTNFTAQALRNCELTVYVSTKLNRSHLIHGEEAIILPCLGRTDLDILNGEVQFVSVENSMGIVHSSQGNLEPISDKLLSEPAIVCHLAKASLVNSKIDWDIYSEHYDRIREDIERTIPGFENYNQRVRIPEGFYLPNGARDNIYNTITSKANFSITELETIPLKDGEFLMMTIRSHDQFNTTIYGLDDRYRGIYNERRVVLMNREDMKSKGLKTKDLVDISNYTGGVERVAKKFIVIEYDIPCQCIATYFPETNVLVPISETADKSGTPVSKSVVVEIKKTSTM